MNNTFLGIEDFGGYYSEFTFNRGLFEKLGSKIKYRADKVKITKDENSVKLKLIGKYRFLIIDF